MTLQEKALAYNREAKEAIWNELNKGHQGMAGEIQDSFRRVKSK